MKSMSPDRVEALPGLGKVSNTQFAGYASIYPAAQKERKESLFYWFVGAENYKQKPTIIWSNGGPGSSSFWGFFIENGPYTIQPKTDTEESKLIPNPNGWNNYANYMIFEHPLSVTLSFANDKEDIPQTPRQGAQQYYQALLHFLEMHPEIAKNPIILAGESYAGTYLPLLAQTILDGNDQGNLPIQLHSTVLGDAWVDPIVQMKTDTLYAYTHGLITKAQKEQLDVEYADNLYNLNAEIGKICGVYMTNIAQTADPAFAPVFEYLNRADVRKALHIPVDTPLTENWSKEVSDNYTPFVKNSYRPVVQELLQRNHKVLVVSGLNDAKDCNFLGTEAWLSLLHGDIAEKFQKTTPTQWKDTDGNVIGFYQNAGVLSWLKVLNAGHMAVRDQPLIIKQILADLL